jgi:O-acetyl-ADP-ribose deacetylase (regulator of RNase III)
MPIIKIKKGNLLDCEENIIVQQCNCVTTKSHGLSEQIANKFPWANVYGQRESINNKNRAKKPEIPGTLRISVSESESESEKKVIHLFAQNLPSKPGVFNSVYFSEYSDTKEDRLKYFKECIDKLDSLNFEIVAMPYMIGCGLAGGKWNDYEKILNNSKTNIILYKL